MTTGDTALDALVVFAVLGLCGLVLVLPAAVLEALFGPER